MQEKNKRKFPLWVHPETLENVKGIYKKDNCKSQSEFIEKAILFYNGYLTAEDNKKYLPQTITSTVKGIVDDSENRIARLLFKMAVEMAIMMNIAAANYEVDEQKIKEIRARCVKEVKESNGAILFVDAVRYQKS
jgi:uncharacterized protein (DUF1499 family)